MKTASLSIPIQLHVFILSRMQPSAPKTDDLTSRMLQTIGKPQNRSNDTCTNRIYADFECKSDGSYQIVPNPKYDTNEDATKKRSAAEAEPRNITYATDSFGLDNSTDITTEETGQDNLETQCRWAWCRPDR